MKAVTLRRAGRWLVGLLFFLGLAGCNLPGNAVATPTMNVTQAYQTVEARLTQAIAETAARTLAPIPNATETPQPTEGGAASATPPETSLPTQETSSTSPSPPGTSTTSAVLCDRASPGIPIDVTIPDDTELESGEDFTKTWRLENVGSCTWTTDYSLVYFSGEQLGAPQSVPLRQAVAPGETVELSVEMQAPEEPGTYQSNWKLSNANGALFGIGPNGDSAFWVRIVVIRSSTPTVTITPEVTNSPTLVPTVAIQASGPATLQPGDALDLDSNQVNSGGEDLTYTASEEAHTLTPTGGAAIVAFGSERPSLADCETVTLSADPLPVDGLSGTYLCYRSGMALPGWALVTGLDSSTGKLDLEINTWAIP